MEFTLKLLEEHAELTIENAMLRWKAGQYEELFMELMNYLCEEDLLGKEYLKQYKKMNDITKGRAK